MFKKTTFRLTAIYLTILMLISLFFSASLYNILSNELNRSVARQTQMLDNSLFGPIAPSYEDNLHSQRDKILDDAHNRLVLRIAIINLLILVGGGLLSYALARKTLEPIREVHESQSRFIADASHELRTPITAMKTEAEVALDDNKLSSVKMRKLLQSNIEELDKLTALTDGLLRLAKLDGSSHQKDIINIDEVIQDAIDKVLPLAENKKILINPRVKKAKIIGDKHLITEMLVTILDNAIKYSPNKTEVSVRTISTKTHVKIAVSDCGEGIRASELGRIFDRFYRVDGSRTKTKAGGYGLGLAIAKSIADSHKGSIDVASSTGSGTVFTINLPRVY